MLAWKRKAKSYRRCAIALEKRRLVLMDRLERLRELLASARATADMRAAELERLRR